MSNSGNNDEVLGECATIGTAILAAQRIEFLLYGIIAHIKPESKERDKRHLTGESFLRGDVSDLRATLGQIAKVYGTEFLLSADDLEAFVKNRNLIVHDYWRLTKGLIRDGQTLENGVPAGIPWRLPTMGRNPPRRSGRNEAERRPSDW